MINVNYCYNIYIDVPNSIQTNVINDCYFHVDIYQNNNDEPYLTFDSSDEDLIERFKYNFSLFRTAKKTWIKMPKNGLIVNSQYSRIAIKNIIDYNNTYRYKYYFYVKVDSQTQQIIKTEELYATPPSQKPIVDDLKFRIHVAQLITQQQPILSWRPAEQIDGENIKYEIQLYQQQQLEPCKIDNIEQPQIINGKVFYQLNKNEIRLKEQILYRWRVRAIDQFGQLLHEKYQIQQWRDWSDWHYFKKINQLPFQVTVANRFYNHLNAYAYVTANKQYLYHKLMVINFVNYDLHQFVYVTAKNQQLHFRLYCDGFKFTDLHQFVYVTAKNQQLNMAIQISKQVDTDLHQFVYVTAKNQQLHFKIQVMKLLHFNIPVRAKTDLNFEISVNLLSDLPLGITVIKTFEIYIPMQIRVLGDYRPFVVTFYDSDYNIINTDNRLKIYDQFNNEIVPFDKQGVAVNVYPYVDGMDNEQVDIYDSFGDKITNIYDQNGNIINVYDKKNIVKNWFPRGRYYVSYTDYTDAYYYYRFDRTQTNSFVLQTTENYLMLNIQESGVWRLYISPYVSNNPLFKTSFQQYLYINMPPSMVLPPFYIDGQLIVDNVVIRNSLPIFSFTPIVSNDNDIIKYHLIVSQDPTFSNDNAVDTYIDNINSMIHYQFQDGQFLQEQGLYYIYLATCDYNGDQKKTQVKYNSNLIFEYKRMYSDVHYICQIVNYNWVAVAFQLIVNSRIDLPQKICVMRWSDSYEDATDKDLNGMLIITKWLTEEQQQMQCYQLGHLLTVRNKFDLTNSLTVRQKSDLNINVVIPKVYQFDFPIGSVDTPITSIVQVVYSTQNPKNLDNYDADIYNLPFKLTVEVLQKHDLYQSITVGTRDDENDAELQFQCQVWNDHYHPIKNRHDLNIRFFVSNHFQPPSGALYFKLNLFYPQPPMVIIESNVPQFTWQNNYNVVYNLSLVQQSVVPLARYQYVFSTKEKNINWEQCSYSYNGYLKIDVRDKLLQLSNRQTGILYLHVRSVNQKNVKSSYVSTYCIFYNNIVQAPIIQYINGEYVVGNQRPIVNYTKSFVISWTRVYDKIDVSDKITYQLQMSKDYRFTTVDYQAKQINGNFYTVMAKTIAPGLYYCRVRAFDQNQYSQWSLMSMCYINKTPSAPVDLRVKNVI